MTADRWAQAVRQQLGLGRVLPLGEAGDGAWVTEGAARGALRRAVATMPGVRLGALRLALCDPGTADEPAVPAPPSALPPGPLRIDAQCEVTADEPLPQTAARLRAALTDAARERLGLVVAEVDLEVTALLDEAPRPQQEPEPGPAPAPAEESAPTGDAGRAARAALGVAGVARLTGALGGMGRAVHITETAGAATLPRRHVRLELAVASGQRALDVARAVREAVTTALPDGPTVAVLVTDVDA
ncbi:nucleopolyhedrovirus P10 family protein [Streptomyces sp. VRA16 Mangrove soil]|uniref:nucleopolyhedrovirus P10 family protein n=1 Tax=Streptomyces sp. VRA16 Mangrove soil TaxID=2817434 RepID=UPI001A9F7E1B|nr:nucleopolyhedrovirus P10 family protein [Streptomyces sp. VRA16 Mangrove soil]MBO1335203.1 nucleopolyhedrovirus P10 family protein [Streptomyces sp. VRA16 Mangrove soil]